VKTLQLFEKNQLIETANAHDRLLLKCDSLQKDLAEAQLEAKKIKTEGTESEK
jgi:chromosome segregation ATPase